MENPIKQLRITTIKQRFVIGLQILLLLVVSSALLYSPKYFEEKNIQNNKEIVEKNLSLSKETSELRDALIKKNEEIKKKEEELLKREAELKKFKVLSKLIQIRIREVNSRINIAKAEEFANHIIVSSRAKGVNTLLLTELIASESSFDKNVKHSIKGVKGLTGVYAKYWIDDLRSARIIKKESDLDDPLINITAGAHILSVYIKENKTLQLALTKYKGESNLGANQARSVLLATAKLQAKGNSVLL